jgi:ATP-dependent DNA helicase RecG
VHDVAMTIAPWASAQLSAELPRLVKGGESETVEFKRELPKQVQDLAKEIAAFASTRGGQLLLGVDDSGSIVGIANAHDPAVRDELGRRIVGVCQSIDPPVRPQIAWASTSDVSVLVIAVEKGVEPLYYVNSRPYIRHDTVSRPAKPSEVLEATTVIASRKAMEATKSHLELSKLADVLANVRRWCDTDAEMRSLKPWVEEWSADAELYASKLRDLSISDWSMENHTDVRLEAMADKLEEVVQFRHYLGGGGNFDEICDAAGIAAAELMRDLVDPIEVGEETQRQVLDAIAKHARKLSQIWSRAGKDIFDGRVERAQQETYSIGQQIATWSYFQLSLVPKSTLSNLRRIGLGLVELASISVYMDGGASLQHIVDTAQALADALKTNIESFPRRGESVQ